VEALQAKAQGALDGFTPFSIDDYMGRIFAQTCNIIALKPERQKR
jgi:hypothetical protein